MNPTLRWAPLILAVVVFGFYASSAKLDFVYDDHHLILASRAPESPGEVAVRVGGLFAAGDPNETQLAYYRPLSRASYVIQRYVHGDAPGPYHVVNAMVTGLAALAAFALFRCSAFGLSPRLAAWAAALFAFHPVAATCTWAIANRETALMAIFALLAVRSFLGPGGSIRAAAGLWLAAALVSKEQAVCVPLLMGLADALRISPGPRPATFAGWLRRYSAVAAAVVGYLVLRAVAVSEAPPIEWALFERPWGPLASLLYTAQVILVPTLELVYEPTWPDWRSLPRAAVALAGVALALAVAARAESTHRRRFAFWLGWTALCALPTAGLLEQETRFAERYALLSLVGAVGFTATWAAQREATGPAGRVWGLAVVMVVLLAGISWARQPYFSDSLRFHAQWARTSPGVATAHFNYSVALNETGDVVAALESLERSLALDPDHPGALNNRAWLLATHPDASLRDPAEALALAERLCAGGCVDPGPLDTLAAAQAATGRFDEARATAVRALEAARANGPQELVPELTMRARLYERGRPYRDRPHPGASGG